MLRRLFLSALALLALAMPAAAAPINISGSGTFGASAPTTNFSRPNGSFTFSFAVNDPLTGTPNSAGNISGVPVLSAYYLLDGVAVTPTITSVNFYTLDSDGLFDLLSGNNLVLSLRGLQIYDVTTRSLISGTYAASIGSSDPNFRTGTGTVTVGNGGVVPEPASLALVGLGLAGVGVMARRRRKG